MPVHDKHILVLHGPVHRSWDEVFNSLVQQAWAVHHCASDLLLVTRLGQVTDPLVLCVGSVESLTAKSGRLLAWLRQRGVPCCAWATRSSSWDMIEQVQSLGVPVFTRKEAFNVWVERLENAGQGTDVLPCESHIVTDAEMSALFGDDGDE
jgi:hypothetical protein